MIPRCTVFLFTDDFTFPNKPASFVIKDADSVDIIPIHVTSSNP